MTDTKATATTLADTDLDTTTGGAFSPTAGLNARMFNPQPEPPAHLRNAIDPAADLKSKSFDPQPEPPAKMFRV